MHCFYGTATVGERGQLVIPSEARTELGINPGDKLLVMKHPEIVQCLPIGRPRPTRAAHDVFLAPN